MSGQSGEAARAQSAAAAERTGPAAEQRGHAPTTPYDAVVVGASLAGCTAATLLARAGARVALVDRRPDPDAYKRVCGHYIMPSAVPTLERLGLMDAIAEAGGVRSPMTMWTHWGRIRQDTTKTPPAVNIRRRKLDPLIRRLAAEQPGVDLILGRTVRALVHENGTTAGVEIADRNGATETLSSRLVIGADGRDSTVAKRAEVRTRSHPHGRFSYGAYYAGPPPEGAPGGTVWFLDPDWAAAFPTDDGLTLYAVMPTKDRLPEFRGDRAAALERFVASLPEAPPITESTRVDDVIGKIEMPNVRRGPIAPGLALAGDAALATDPLWGVGCGWALQTGEWLADAVAPALAGDLSLERALRRYRRTFTRRLAGHAFMIDQYAGGRRMDPMERTLFAAAASDQRIADRMVAMGTRSVAPQRMFTPATALRIARAHARRRLRTGGRARTAPGPIQPLT